MSEWRTWPLGEIATVVDCEHKTAPAAAKGQEFGFSVGTPHIRHGRIDYDNAKRVSKETYEAWSRRAVLGSGDLILAREAPVGQVALIDGSTPTCLGQRTVLIRPDHSAIIARYLHGYLLGHQAQRWMLDRSSGSTVAHLNVSDVREIPVAVPPLEEQRRIASVLGTIDHLLETNRRLIQSSREFSRAFYASAVDEQHAVPFGEIAELVLDGVKADAIDPAASYVALEHFATEGGGLQAVGDASVVDSNKSRFVAGDVLYGKLRPYFRKFDRPGFDGICSTEVWVLRPKAPYGAATLDAIVSQPGFTEFAMAGSGGTRMPRADWKHVVTMPTPLPPEAQREHLNDQLEQLWLMRVALNEEIVDLIRTRDELLPLLMSGKIRVDDSRRVARWP